MEEKLITYLCSVEKVDAKLLHQLVDTFGTEMIEQCLLKSVQRMDSQDGDFYEKQLQIWDKFGYYLAGLVHNPFEEQVLKSFCRKSKSPVKKSYSSWEDKIQREPLFTLEEEVQYGFHLLSRPYIQLFLKDEDDITLDVLKIFSSIQTVEERDLILEKFKKFYQQCSRTSNFDRQFQKFLFAYQEECKNTPLPDVHTLFSFFDDCWKKESFEVIDKRDMLEQLDMYFRYSMARNLFSICNLKLVESISYKYKNVIDQEEIVQYGVLGLIRAIQTFDIRKCHKFSTYANYWVSLSINRMIENHIGTIRIPVYVQLLKFRIEKVQREFYQKNGRNPKEEELALGVGVSIEQLRNVLYRTFEVSCDSLDRFTRLGDKDSDWQLWEVIEDKQDGSKISLEEQYVFQELLHHCMEFMDSRLSDREKKVLFKRTGYLDDQPMTLEEIGKEFGCSRENVRLIEEKALKKLRRIPRFKDYNPFQ